LGRSLVSFFSCGSVSFFPGYGGFPFFFFKRDTLFFPFFSVPAVASFSEEFGVFFFLFSYVFRLHVLMVFPLDPTPLPSKVYRSSVGDTISFFFFFFDWGAGRRSPIHLFGFLVVRWPFLSSTFFSLLRAAKARHCGSGCSPFLKVTLEKPHWESLSVRFVFLGLSFSPPR